jgi:hypothetical protein
MSCPRDAADLWHVCSLSWICGKNKKKIIWRKIIAIHNVFKEKTIKINS